MISERLPNIRGLIIDMDGVLWHDHEPLGDLPAIFSQLHDYGYKVILATNNNTRNIDDYHNKLRGFGVQLEEWQIINAAQAVGRYLQEKYPEGARVYVVGEASLKKTLSDYGMRVVSDDVLDADVVVASLDYGLTYEKLKRASLMIQSGSDFIGTNPDVTLPTPVGLIPGAGTVIGALEIASGKKAKIIGKPEPALYEMALGRLNLCADDTLAIGDRLETDILGAQAAGIHTALVLSGASTDADLRDFHPKPDIIAQDLTELVF
ncbi:MAG: HAD-IIA family hydrolase [Brevefilum sp.]|nr:HAD-IIA family hydrolase [Brevefilum sp.]